MPCPNRRANSLSKLRASRYIVEFKRWAAENGALADLPLQRQRKLSLPSRARNTQTFMASEVNKNLERGRRSFERNKLREAVAAYQAVLEEAPGNLESLQALADIYSRLNEPARAAQFYGAQFDRLLESGDASKASAIYARFLRAAPQPPDRLMRYAGLLQKQNRISEAIEQFASAATLFLQQQREIEALACYESLAQLEPENPARHATLGELAEKLSHADLAGRCYLRAGQLTIAGGGFEAAIGYLGRAHALLPKDRSVALLFAEAKLRQGDAEDAAALLEPFAPDAQDAAFLALYGESMMHTGRLDRASAAFEAHYRLKPESAGKLFEVMAAYLKAGEDAKAGALLKKVKGWTRQARTEADFPGQMDRLADAYPRSLPLAEAIASAYEELNRESKYFDALVHVFDLYLAAGRVREACEALDRLVDIDPYDYRNPERIAQLEGKADPAYLRSIQSRAAKASTAGARSEDLGGTDAVPAAGPVSGAAPTQHTLEDLMVQAEIFLQYSLQSKAAEKLGLIAELFPGEEERNERLRALCERAGWRPKGAPRKPAPSPAAEVAAPTPAPISTAAETHRDLSAIAEINRQMFRQATPREALAAAAAGIGKHLGVARCLIVAGAVRDTAPLTAEYFAPGIPPAGEAPTASIAELVSQSSADALGTIELRASTAPGLRALGLESALVVKLTDKETQAPAGTLLVGDSRTRTWKPGESFFLQAAGDQLVLSASHMRLRSLVRSLAVANERTGLLSRGSYMDCLLAESNRARAQGTPLSLILLQIDKGSEILRQHGDAALEQYSGQLARALASSIRQTDIAVKYTAWSIVFVLPDTPLDSARALAEKLRQVAATVRPAWGAPELTVSAVVAEATSRPADETEDRVTEWINRAEEGVEEARAGGGNTLVALATP